MTRISELLRKTISCHSTASHCLHQFWEIPMMPGYDDVIKWQHFPSYWLFVRGFHRAPVHSPHKSQWRRYLMFHLICAWINSWVNNREAGDLRRHRAHYDIVMWSHKTTVSKHIQAERRIYVLSNFASIGSGKGLSHVQRQAFIRIITSLFIGLTNFNEIGNQLQ